MDKYFSVFTRLDWNQRRMNDILACVVLHDEIKTAWRSIRGQNNKCQEEEMNRPYIFFYSVVNAYLPLL